MDPGSASGQGERPEARWSGGDFAACLASVALGLILAVAPHLATLVRHGTLEFLADADDTAYLAIARAPYYGEPGLRDPFLGRWEQAPPSLYPWALFVPLARLAHGLGLPLILLGLLWRAVGGCLLGGAVFLLFRRLFAPTRHPTAWALGCAMICLADAGFVGGRMIVQTLALPLHLWAGTTPVHKPDALAQYRVITPLLNLPFLLLLAGTLIPGGSRRAKAVLLGSVWLGICIFIFFYFWTAAVGAMVMYLIGLAFVAWRWPQQRSAALAQAWLVALVLVGGMLLGGFQIYSNTRTFADPYYQAILPRMFKPYRLPAGDPIRWMFVKNVWTWAKLAIGAVAILALRLPGLGLPWCLTMAGYLLANSAIITGMEFENSHWGYVHSPMGEVMVLAALGLWADRQAWRVPAWAAWLVPAVMVAIALVWRPYEALHAPDSAENSRILAELKPLRPALAALGPDHALAGPPATNIAILYSRCALLYHSPYSWTFSMVPESLLHERHALNGWLQGLNLAQYEAYAGNDTNTLFKRPEWSEQAILQARAPIFRQLLEHPAEAEALLDRFRPDALLLPASAPQPERGGPWALAERTPRWALWTRLPAEGRAGGAHHGSLWEKSLRVPTAVVDATLRLIFSWELPLGHDPAKPRPVSGRERPRA